MSELTTYNLIKINLKLSCYLKLPNVQYYKALSRTFLRIVLTFQMVKTKIFHLFSFKHYMRFCSNKIVTNRKITKTVIKWNESEMDHINKIIFWLEICSKIVFFCSFLLGTLCRLVIVLKKFFIGWSGAQPRTSIIKLSCVCLQSQHLVE